jgi:hypothetical protein
MAHRDYGAVKAAQHGELAVDRRIPVTTGLAQMLQVLQHIARRDLVGWRV